MARPKKQPSPEKEQASALNTQEVKEETETEKRARRILQAGAATKKKLKEIPEPQEAIEAQEAKEAKEATKAAKIIDKINLVSFSIDFMKDPSDALLSRNFVDSTGRDITGLVYRKWHDAQYNQLIQQVSEEIGADPEKLKEKEHRTPEQQKALEEASAKKVIDRFDRFFDSTYYKAFESLQKEFYLLKYGKTPIGSKQDFENTMQKIENDIVEPTEDDTALQNQVLLYFFATHEKVKPTGSEPLTEKEHTDLIDILHKLFDFYKNTGKKINFESFFDFIQQDAQPKPKKKVIAEAEGAITTIGERLLVISDKDYQDALITKLGESGLYFRDKNGKKSLALDINQSFIRAVGRAALFKFFAGQAAPDAPQEIKMYIPDILNELGLNITEKERAEEANGLTRAESRAAFIYSIITKLDDIWGVLPRDKEEYKFISVYSYNPETEQLTFVSPYFHSLFMALAGKEAEKIESGAHYHYWQCELLHSTAANERNQAAVEMAAQILVGLQQRGTTTPDAELNKNKGKTFKDKAIFTYSITCKGLVQACPQIREKLKTQPTSTKTQTLKRTFAAMYKILKTKTDLFSYYADAAIKEVIPTTKSLDAEIIITHKGANPNYKKPFLQITAKKAQEQPKTEGAAEE